MNKKGEYMKLFITFILFSWLNLNAQNIPLNGNPAPDFRLPFATKDTINMTGISTKDFSGKANIIIAFYPADWSGGCTKEFCMMRDNFERLGALDAEVFAISGDYVFSHKEWAKNLKLPFKLLSDHDHAVAKKYESYNDKNGFNKRTVFLIDKEGIIRYSDMNYKTNDDGSFNELKSALEKLK
jgi:peroxiredoxin